MGRIWAGFIGTAPTFASSCIIQSAHQLKASHHTRYLTWISHRWDAGRQMCLSVALTKKCRMASLPPSDDVPQQDWTLHIGQNTPRLCRNPRLCATPEIPCYSIGQKPPWAPPTLTSPQLLWLQLVSKPGFVSQFMVWKDFAEEHKCDEKETITQLLFWGTADTCFHISSSTISSQLATSPIKDL